MSGKDWSGLFVTVLANIVGFVIVAIVSVASFIAFMWALSQPPEVGDTETVTTTMYYTEDGELVEREVELYTIKDCNTLWNQSFHREWWEEECVGREEPWCSTLEECILGK